jgi:uncharacterized membrane protein
MKAAKCKFNLVMQKVGKRGELQCECKQNGLENILFQQFLKNFQARRSARMKRYTIFVFSLFLLMIFAVYPAIAEPVYSGAAKDGFEFISPFSGIVMGSGEKADLDLKIKNLTHDERAVDLKIKNDPKAEQWKVMFSNSQWGGFGVTRVRLGTEEPDDQVELKLHIEPSKDARPGEYTFLLTALSDRVTREIPVVVHLQGDKVALEKDKGDIILDCKYTSIQNPSGSQFKYDIDVKNESGEDSVVDFTATVPDGWGYSLSPKWESGKDVDSIRLDKNGSEKLSLTLTPPAIAEEGKYPVRLIAKSGEISKQLDLSAVIKGSYKLQMIPETKRLNVDLVAGQENKMVFYLWNEGSSPVNNVSLFSSQPDGWEVSFEPEKLSQVESLSKTEKPEKVTVTFKVPQRTIPGDYAIHLTAAGDQSRVPVDLRATVEVPTRWGWTGIAVIVVVIVLLAGIFLRLKRR